ncbi:hypothetical protein O4H49_08365 [Kiloniella laminariae]|uniref:Uncharacterized protein n=1 Tax=Kiloniella laminariae TaxID=454162 RepID=A0ABT4LI52_9PROT|nr:hypothetical protein [Kiloniella laminariae]MCZ4280788.1 hypothetical protein [Kiloniella laminariae]
MKAIKSAVVIMSILLVLGFGVVIYTIATRVSSGVGNKEDVSSESVSLPESQEVQAFPQAFLELPAGCELVASQLQGNRVLLQFGGNRERGCQQVLLFSAISGERLGGWSLAAPTAVAE